MTTAKTDFQHSAAPGEDLSRRLAYLATQDNGSVMTGGFAKAPGLDGADDDKVRSRQGISAMEMLAQQEQIRQDQIARLNSKFDALELAAREALFDAENDLATILSNANRATDGRAVFKDKDGNIRDEDGQVVEEGAVDMSDWDAKADSWEAFSQQRSLVDQTSEFYERVQETGDRLDDGVDDNGLAALETELEALESEFAAFETTVAKPAEDSFDQVKHTAPEQSSQFDAFKPM